MDDERRDVVPDGEATLTRRRLLEGSLAGGALLALPGLGAREALGAVRVVSGGRLRSGHAGGGSKESLDPHRNSVPIDVARTYQLFDPLSRWSADSKGRLIIENVLAASVEPNKAATRWQIKLRSGVTFHDGKPLTAADVLYSWTRIVQNKLTSASFLEPIDFQETKVVNPTTISLVLKRPIVNVPLMLVNAKGVVQNGATDFTTPIGSGPFKYVSFTPGDRSLFAKNANYWQPGLPRVDELEMISISDNAARMNALLGGQIDVMEGLDFSQARSLKGRSGLRLVRAGGTTTLPLLMRVDKAPFTDNRVRLAFKYAIDRPKMVSVALLGFGKVGNDVFGKGGPNYNGNLPQHSYDPEKARSLLKQAGREGLTVELTTSTAEAGMLESALAFAEMAKKAGIRVKPRTVPAADFWNPQYYLKVPFGQTLWHSDFEGVAQYGLLSSAAYNETHWHRRSWDAKFRKAQATVDSAKRAALFNEVQQQLWAEGGYIIWGFMDVLDAASSKVRGIVPVPSQPLGNYDFKRFSVA